MEIKKMNKKIKIYEAKLNPRYSYDQISSGTGVTETEALEELKKSAKKWDLSIEELRHTYAVVKRIDITDEANEYKKKADKILTRLEEILNLVPKYDNSLHVIDHPNCVSWNMARIAITHNLKEIKKEINENYKKIYKADTTNGILKFRQLVSHIHLNFFIRYKKLKVVTYQFVNPFNVSDHDMIKLNCRYFGNLNQGFCVDLNLKYANEILASSFATRGYLKKWEHNENGEIIGGGYQA